jgi:hypothetical protein
MTIENRTLFVHAGGPKTGSSAIQVFLAVNAQALRTLGFSYRTHGSAAVDEYEGTSGNGLSLFEELASNRSDAEVRSSTIRELLLNYFYDENREAICSSENFSLLSPESWSSLRQIAAEEHIDLIVCYYARHLSAFISSSYDQALRHGFSHEWKAFLSIFDAWEHCRALEHLAQTFSKDSLRILSYDACKQRLVESFLAVLGVAEHFDTDTIQRGNKRIVNRSLTNMERDILRVINGATANQYSKRLSNALLVTNPNSRPEPLDYDEAEIRKLEDKFGKQAEWINNNFFNGQEMIKIFDSGAKVDDAGRQSCEEQLKAYRVAFEMVAEHSKNSRNTAITEIAGKLLAIDWENAGDPALPEDFDPIGYLLCNQDLCISEVKPIRHYIQFGSLEGRIWKI